ncbi:MAG: CHAT domain-containing protein [Verrucomicrobia bacterium]|nr:CHAT domain-containing protein [Verrucomicrobiota bacterium]
MTKAVRGSDAGWCVPSGAGGWFFLKRIGGGFRYGLGLLAAVALSAGEGPGVEELEAELQREEQQGRWTNVVRIAREIVARVESVHGAEASETAAALDQLGRRVVMWGSKEEAEALHRRALAIRVRLFGPDHPETARSYFRLGVFLKNALRERDESGELLRRCLAIREREAGAAPAALVDVLVELGWYCMRYNDYAEAEALLVRACGLAGAGEGGGSPAHADAHYALGWVYYHIRDFARAGRSFERAYALKRVKPGPEHWETMEVANALAAVYRDAGRFAEARELSELALRVRERSFGPNHAKVAESLCGLGITYELMRQPEQARPYFERAIPIIDKVYQGKGFHLMEAHHHLSRVWHDLGQLAAAEEHAQVAVRLSELETEAQASSSAAYFEHLAEVNLELGKEVEALEYAQRGRVMREKLLASALSFTSERQRLDLLSGKVRPHFLATLGVANPLAEAVLRTKGLVVDSLVEDALLARLSGDTAVIGLLEQLQECQGRKADLWSAASRAAVEGEIEELEAALARRVGPAGRARRALQVTVAEVRRAMPQGAALIEYVRYDRYLGYLRSEPEYGAIVLSGVAEPVWIRLGSADGIEREFRRVRHGLRNGGEDPGLRDALRRLTGLVWEPVARVLPPGIKHVIVSPDAVLSLVSFAALSGDGQTFVGEQYWVSYVSSGRDLLASEHGRQPDSGRLCILASPDYGREPAGGSEVILAGGTRSAALSTESRGFSFRPLPGAAREGRLLRERATEFGFSGADLYVGEAATESVLRRVADPRVLHVATHGFSLPKAELTSGGAMEATTDGLTGLMAAGGATALWRSGLLLAGARDSLARRAAGEILPLENDGIVTADEVATLNLRGTRLVVLSSCDSGLGEVEAGEGVLGLRRGFVKAGVRNLMLTLWQVDDGATTPLMVDFYELLYRRRSAPQALAMVQREWLGRLRAEQGFVRACRVAGPFILSFQGTGELGSVQARQGVGDSAP